ncbi:MFS transporter [Ornithinimicrobium faecis]|uniref:MFS transporter n=1 Tax=Ornithinimicrobium faecis TaxID=2934158 RepID=UPI002118AE8D|nr:MFS transporter [Ornithinimicrobium sp. HY1745]
MAAGVGVFSYPAFVRLWISDTVKWLGVFTSGLALQLLLIETLSADQVALGVVKSAQFLPMLLFGLLAGVLIDRVWRRPVLVVGDAVCAVAYGAIGVLGLLGQLSVPLVAALVFVAGTAALSATAAHQSFLPRLVPTSALSRANARIEQSMTGAEAVGPLLAGVLVRTVSAPVAILVNAATYATSALVLSTIRVTEPAPADSADRHLWRELKEGARWVYRHPELAPYAIGLHTWFFFNSAVMTILVFFASQEIGLGPVVIGLVLATAGVSGVAAAGLTPRVADRFGAGRVMCGAAWLAPLAFLFTALAPNGTAGLPVLIAGQLVYGVSNGLRGPLEMSYRNAVTPDRLRARMNSTIRSLNWGTITVSAPLAGWFAVTYGNRPTILVCVVGLAVAALIPTLSPFRTVQMPDDDLEEV